ncbi:hypothetical protein ACIPQJ_30835 [Streptomyces sp. NPDC090082]
MITGFAAVRVPAAVRFAPVRVPAAVGFALVVPDPVCGNVSGSA